MSRRWLALLGALGGCCVALAAYAASPQWDQSIAIVDSADPHKQATVSATGALKVDGSAAGGGTVTLGAGSAIAGKVGIDQTTPGTTNGVQVNNFPTTGNAANNPVYVQDGNTSGSIGPSNPMQAIIQPAPQLTYTCSASCTTAYSGAGVPTGFPFDGSAYGVQSVRVQVTGQASGATLNWDVSEDGATWKTAQSCYRDDYSNVTTSLGNAGTNEFWCPVGRYMRLNFAAYSSGTISGIVTFLSSPSAPLPFAQPVALTADHLGRGASATHVISTASTNSTSIKGGVGTLRTIYAVNTNAAAAYLKFYNKSTAPTCNSDTVTLNLPLIQNIPISFADVAGVQFGSGIGLCITGAQADNDNTNATTGITVNVSYR